MDTFEWTEETPVTANNLNEMQTILGRNFQLKGKLLWTNPSPLSSFEPDSITLSSDDYDVLEIYYYDWTTSKRMKSVKALKGENILIDTSFYSGTDYYVASREMTYNSNTSYSVGNCVSLYGTTTTAIVNPINFVCVPVKILGYKTGLFE